ncbi:MAG: tetratricopeptide repeat protein, partial [Candidatus Bathyarchaeota archaeon]|nr:tetratricopeptide repeat protein [Candidatus Bathyarchaeota archaeon]
AVEAYEKAKGIYEKVADEVGAGWVLRCEAVTRYLEHWVSSKSSEKRGLLDECLELEENALNAFWDTGNKFEYGRTYNGLSNVTLLRFSFEWDRRVQRGILEKGMIWGERAVAALSEIGDPYEMGRAHNELGWNIGPFSGFFVTPENREQYISRYEEHFRKAIDFSEGAGDGYTAGFSYLWLGFVDVPSRDRHHEKALECGEKTKDLYLKAFVLDWLASFTYWKAHATEDPDQRRKLAEEAMVFYDKAQHHHMIMSYQFPFRSKTIYPAPGGYAEYNLDRAEWEVDPEKKKTFLDMSEKDGLKALKVAEDWDIPGFIGRMSHILSRTLTARARLETDVDVKRGLLEKAMSFRERNIDIQTRTDPLHLWNTGVWHILLADIKAELAFIQPDLKGRRVFLEEAMFSKEKGLDNINIIMPIWEEMGDITNFASLSRYQDDYGTILTHLHDVTKNPENLRKAIEIWRKTIESAGKLDMVSRIAESYWKIAKTHDILGEHLEAAENFNHASEGYVKAAEKFPQLKEFYQDYASYMRAWNEIERADHRHAQKEYGEAKEHYEKAAELHRSTERWNYLASNYQAWARLDEAEDLSRREQTQEARDLFQQAVKLFSETEDSIKSKLNTIEVGEEMQIAEELIKASDVRREYSLGRAALEEAKILDRQGDHLASSKRYGQAVERFQGVVDSFELESDRRELRPIVCLCRAWQKMMLA